MFLRVLILKKSSSHWIRTMTAIPCSETNLSELLIVLVHDRKMTNLLVLASFVME